MWSSPAVAGPRLHLALQQALQRAVDPSGQASQSDLEHWLDGASGALGRLRLQFAPREGCPLRAPSSLPVPDPDEPETAADLEASDLAIVDVRRGVLARLLLGRFETDAAACGAALATHALVHALADIARHPVTWSQARSTLRARTPALRHSSELGMDRLLGALLELAALSTGPVGTPAFDIDLQLELGPTGLLYQPLDPSREDSPSVPVGRCAACGVFGLAMAQSDDGLTAEGARVHRVWAAEGSHRRFLVRGVGLGASQCPVCGSSAVGLLNVPGPALAGLCADLFPAATGAGCPPLPAAAMPVARRCTLRRALVELIGESVPGPSLVQLRERLRRERSAVAAGWSEDQLEWAIYDELGQHSGHALSAERLGLSAVHLAPKAAELMATALAHKLGQRPSVAHDHAVRGAARLMRHAGAIASTGLDRWLKGGRNGLLLPRPFGGGGRSPDVLEPTGQLAARCRDLIRAQPGCRCRERLRPAASVRAGPGEHPGGSPSEDRRCGCSRTRRTALHARRLGPRLPPRPPSRRHSRTPRGSPHRRAVPPSGLLGHPRRGPSCLGPAAPAVRDRPAHPHLRDERRAGGVHRVPDHGKRGPAARSHHRLGRSLSTGAPAAHGIA